jgi:hypothetical protein
MILKKILYLFLYAVLIIGVLASCSDKNEDTNDNLDNYESEIIEAENDKDYNNADIVEPYVSELLRTGEFITAEQMGILKAEALNWQSTITGIGEIAEIVAIEPLDGSEQQVYISVYVWINNERLFNMYEKLQIHNLDGAQARIISASSGAGSGELDIGYKLVKEDVEWIEIFYIFAGDWETNGHQWQNVTEYRSEYIEMLNELSPAERQFK